MNQMRDAIKAAGIDLGSALNTRGANGVPTLDCGIFDPAPEAPRDPTEQKVLKFLRICPTTVGLTAREISGGTGLPISDAKVALAALVTAGTVLSDGGYENQRRYSLAAPVTEQPAPTPMSELSPAEQQLREAAAQHQAEMLAKAPQPKRYEPSEAEVTAELQKRAVPPLTEAERRELRLLEGRTPRNPQQFIKR